MFHAAFVTGRSEFIQIGGSGQYFYPPAVQDPSRETAMHSRFGGEPGSLFGWGPWAILLLIGSLMSPAAMAETPTADVPSELQGEWTATFEDGSSARVVLEPERATFRYTDDSTLAYIEGRFSLSASMPLKVWLTQSAITPAVPDTAWQGAVSAKGDPRYPALFGTDLTLAYDRDKHELTGTYRSPKIEYTSENQYDPDKTEFIEEKIRLASSLQILFTDAEFVPLDVATIYAMPSLGIGTGEVWVEVRASPSDPKFGDGKIDTIVVSVSSDDDTKVDKVTCVETARGSRIFRSQRPVLLRPSFENIAP